MEVKKKWKRMDDPISEEDDHIETKWPKDKNAIHQIKARIH